jgi:hypothetical protein
LTSQETALRVGQTKGLSLILTALQEVEEYLTDIQKEEDQ